MAGNAKYTMNPYTLGVRAMEDALIPAIPAIRVSSFQNRADFRGLSVVGGDDKIVTVTKPANNEGGILDFIKHGMDKPPAVLAYAASSLDVVQNLQPCPDLRISTSASVEDPGLVTYQAKVAVDIFNIYFIVDTPDVSGSPAGPYASEIDVTFTFYFLQKPAGVL